MRFLIISLLIAAIIGNSSVVYAVSVEELVEFQRNHPQHKDDDKFKKEANLIFTEFLNIIKSLDFDKMDESEVKDCNGRFWEAHHSMLSAEIEKDDKLAKFNKEGDSWDVSSEVKSLYSSQFDEWNYKTLSNILHFANIALKVKCYDTAENYYRLVLDRYVGTAYSGFRDKAKLGLEDVKEGRIKNPAPSGIPVYGILGIILLAGLYRYRKTIFKFQRHQ